MQALKSWKCSENHHILQPLNSLRPLLLILAWLPALLPADALASILRNTFNAPPLPLASVPSANPVAAGEGFAPLTLHLDGLHDRGVLVRQNPWSIFDPEGLEGSEVAAVATSATRVAFRISSSAASSGAGRIVVGRIAPAAASAIVTGGTGSAALAGGTVVVVGGAYAVVGGGVGIIGIRHAANIVQFGNARSPGPRYQGGYHPNFNPTARTVAESAPKTDPAPAQPPEKAAEPQEAAETEPAPPEPATDGAGARAGGRRFDDDEQLYDQDASITKTKKVTDKLRREAAKKNEDLLKQDTPIVDDKTKTERRVKNRLNEFKGMSVDEARKDSGL